MSQLHLAKRLYCDIVPYNSAYFHTPEMDKTPSCQSDGEQPSRNTSFNQLPAVCSHSTSIIKAMCLRLKHFLLSCFLNATCCWVVAKSYLRKIIITEHVTWTPSPDWVFTSETVSSSLSSALSAHGSHVALIFPPHFSMVNKVIYWFIRAAESRKATNHGGLVITLFKRGQPL